MKILIVDDSLLDRKLLSRTLTNAGVKEEILQADNGEAALGIIAQNIGEIGLMFLDYQMPNMSGVELMGGLVKVPATANIPIIMITASSAEESKQAAYTVNPKLAGYIIKPYKPDVIIAAIKPYVGI
ncbi:MAG: response regulator [Candidatus Omnitrophica bacterium]|nr:response regulator [Candidatus Omnitrophota bacterium]